MARPAGRVINNPAFALTPSLLAERPQLPVLVTAKVVAKYQNALDDITDDPEQYSTAELSEAHERLGIAQFHYGSWRESVANLAKALEHRRKLPVARSNVLMTLCIAVASFRMGDLEKAEKTLAPMPMFALKLNAPDLAVCSYGNLSLIYLQLGKTKDAVDNAKKGIDLARQMNSKSAGARSGQAASVDTYSEAGDESGTAPPVVLSLARILLTVYLKTNEFGKAEGVLSDYAFSERERLLLLLGIQFAAGRPKDVVRLLEELNALAAANDKEGALPGQGEEEEGGGESKSAAVDAAQPKSEQLHRLAPSELLASHVPFNRAAISTRRQDFAATRDLLQTMLECLEAYAAGADVEGLQDGEDSVEFFHNAPINETPPVRPMEQSLLPRVMQSHALAVRGELELLLENFSAGLAVQAGALLGGVEVDRESEVKAGDEENSLSAGPDDAASVLSKSDSVTVGSTTSKTPSAIASAAATQAANIALAARAKLYPPPSAGPPILESLRLSDGLVRAQATRAKLEQARALLSESTQMLLRSQFGRRNDKTGGPSFGATGEGSDAAPDVTPAPEAGAEAGAGEATSAAATAAVAAEAELAAEQAAAAAAEEEAGDGNSVASAASNSPDFDGETAAAVEGVGLLDTRLSHNRAALYISLLASMPNASRYGEVASLARQNLKKIYGISLSHRGTLGMNAGPKKGVDLTSKIYCPHKHDPLTLTASLMPLLAQGGRNETSLWLEWALASSGGFGLGSMGSAFSYPEFKRDASSKDGIVAPLLQSTNQFTKPNEVFLKEVKARIFEIETAMGNKFDGAESLYKPGDKECRVLLNALLAKVCFQLNLRRDCELAIETLEIITADMRHFTQNMDHTYVAIARRCRYDLEEWKIPSGSSPEGLANKLLALLGHAKTYLSSVEKTNDKLLLRDALKRLMNIYADFSSLPYPDVQPSGYTLGPGESYPPAPGDKDMLASFTAAEVNEKEKTDPLWLRRFGRAKAALLLERYKQVLRVDVLGGGRGASPEE